MAKVVIFGTGAAGRAIYRAIKDKDDIVAFIDNSPSKINTFYKGIKIIAPAELKKLNFDAVLIGGVWADEMSAQLLNLGIDKEKIKLIDDKDISYSTDNRAKTTNYYVKSLVGILDELGYDYFIDGSGLLSILRKRELSVVSDVDIMLFENKSLSNLANILPQVFPELNIEIRYCQKDYAARKKGDIFNIIITYIAFKRFGGLFYSTLLSLLIIFSFLNGHSHLHIFRSLMGICLKKINHAYYIVQLTNCRLYTCTVFINQFF